MACQTYNTKDIRKNDYFRTFKFSLLGTAFTGPVLHFWYGLLQRAFPSTAIQSVLQRLVLDQLFFSPIFLSCFLSLVLCLEGNAEGIPKKLQMDFAPTVVANLVVWIPAMFINFRFIPNRYQVRFLPVTELLWN